MKELIEQIESVYAQFISDAHKHYPSDNKSAGVRARKASIELRKLLKEYREKSLI